MTTETRLRFMAGLAKLTQPDWAENATSSLVAMLPMLVHIPERAFASKDCLSRVATAKRRTIVPSYADIEAALNGWVRDNIGDAKPSIGRDQFGLDGMDLQWFDYFSEREAEGFKPVRPGAPRGRDHVLSLIRAQSLRAWAAIVGEPLAQTDGPTDEERADVAEVVQRIKDMLRAPRAPSASTMAAQMAAVRAGTPVAEFGVVPPERIAALRDADPLVQRARAFKAEPPRSADELFQ